MKLEIDHFVLGAPDLESGCQYLGDLLKVQPAFGGVHKGRGTQNALLSLGDSVYLEVLVPSEEAGVDSTIAENLKTLAEPALLTWVMRTDQLDTIAKRAEKAAPNVDLIGPAAFERRMPSGETLNWDLLFLENHGFGSLVPFFIDWRNAPHPARSAPVAGAFQDLSIRCEAPTGLNGFFDELGIPQRAIQADRPELKISIATESGEITLASTQQALDAWAV